jgi:hypothetical protein
VQLADGDHTTGSEATASGVLPVGFSGAAAAMINDLCYKNAAFRSAPIWTPMAMASATHPTGGEMN